SVAADSERADAEGPDAEGSDPADAAGPDDTDNGTQASLDRGLRHPELFEGIPLIDGETTHDIAGQLTNGGTRYESLGIGSEQPWQEAADEVYAALQGSDFTEHGWAV